VRGCPRRNWPCSGRVFAPAVPTSGRRRPIHATMVLGQEASAVPYRSNDDLPARLRRHLPSHAWISTGKRSTIPLPRMPQTFVRKRSHTERLGPPSSAHTLNSMTAGCRSRWHWTETDSCLKIGKRLPSCLIIAQTVGDDKFTAYSVCKSSSAPSIIAVCRSDEFQRVKPEA